MPSAPPICSAVLIIPAASPASSSGTAVRPVGSLTVSTIPSPRPWSTSPGIRATALAVAGADRERGAGRGEDQKAGDERDPAADLVEERGRRAGPRG